ncbi:hypothetical protein HPP92_003974 [Vanilla planifolia]|uniref:Digalactosyldiacylglycerol synthase n=1 Tax=Vanilla planifolia TaxID=51239 RepID=A0A835VLZ9_VANPL|nr:hypothetical protein HPP92_003974 [Vanilla planifolia]
MKRIQPKLSEFRRAYSSPDFSRKVLERWPPRPSIRIDLSGIRNAIVSEVDGRGGLLEFEKGRPRQLVRRIRWKERNKMEEDKEWEPIRQLKARFREFDQKSQSNELFSNFKNNELVEKVKLSLVYTPLDLSELLAYLVKQSLPWFDQLGIKRDICEKIVESLCSKRKDHMLFQTISIEDDSLLENHDVKDELDFRIASVLQSTGYHSDGGFWTDFINHENLENKHHVAIVTTASLPWMTGTAVNPLFRAAYLSKEAKQKVTLLVPWLCKADQELVYPNSQTFSTPEEQETYIRSWLEERVGFKTDFKISFYPGKFSKERRSIIPVGDTSQFIPSQEADIAILEEPEHLNWYYHGKRWTDKFNHVVGIVHTNYLEYIKREKNGAIQAFLVKHINNLVARAYCHKVLRLSAATQDLPRSVICNVHGVNPKFLEVGEKVAAEKESGKKVFSKGAYFWARWFGPKGEDSHDVQYTARKLQLNVNFMNGRDHADDSLHGYKVFINPSVSDVLCTATAEALAMGKFVVCADHPSNDFFRYFPNCLTYKTSEEFVARVKEALTNEPQPLTPEQRYTLSWEAATHRFIKYSDVDRMLSTSREGSTGARRGHWLRGIKKSFSMPSLFEVVDGGLSFAHYCLTGNELLRLSTGGIPGTRDYDKQHCIDLHLLPPQVQNPVYGWLSTGDALIASKRFLLSYVPFRWTVGVIKG